MKFIQTPQAQTNFIKHQDFLYKIFSLLFGNSRKCALEAMRLLEEIDNKVIEVLNSIKNIEIDIVLPNTKIISEELSLDFREIKGINTQEKEQILSKFISYINEKSGYSFSIF